MSTPPPVNLGSLPRPSRRELIVACIMLVLRLILGFAVIVFILTLVPEEPDGRIVAPFLVAILAVIGYIWFFRRQLRSISGARFPTLQAVEALILVAAMFLAIFAMFYVIISQNDPTAFTEELAPFTSYYFALTVLATVGFGDITPVTVVARSVTMLQMALDLAFVAIIIKVIANTTKRALQNKQAQNASTIADPDIVGDTL